MLDIVSRTGQNRPKLEYFIRVPPVYFNLIKNKYLKSLPIAATMGAGHHVKMVYYCCIIQTPGGDFGAFGFFSIFFTHFW